MSEIRRYVMMSLQAATVVTFAAVVLFTAFGSFHWRLWWLVPPVWAVLFVLALLLAPALGVEPGADWSARLPWLALVLISGGVLTAAVLGVEGDWTRLSLALLGAAGLGAGVYGARGARPRGYRGRDRRQNLALRARTDELLEAIRTMHRIARRLESGELAPEEATRSMNAIEARLRELLAEIRNAATAPAAGGKAAAAPDTDPSAPPA
jgi:hypothetical protein